MHKTSISQSIIDRVVARRGREHIFDDLVPARTALVVVDMQNGFMLPEVGHAPCKMAFEIVPNINRLAQAVRDTGGAVIWIHSAYTDETLTSWSTLYGMMKPAGRERRKFSLSRANKGYDIFSGLKVEKADVIVEKNRYSAFIQGSSNIEEVLRAYRTVLLPEMNLGQLAMLLRARFLIDVRSYMKVQGQPIHAAEIEDEIVRGLDS